MNITQPEKERNPSSLDNMHETWEHYAKWNKSDRKMQILYDITYLCNFKMLSSEQNGVCHRVGSGGNEEMLVPGYKFPIIQ